MATYGRNDSAGRFRTIANSADKDTTYT